MEKLAEFLLALGNMVRRGDIRRVEDALRFAENQFGKVTPLLKKQIERIMSRGKNQEPGAKKEGEVIDVSFKPGKSKYSDKVIEESPSQKGIEDLNELTQMLSKNPFRPGGPLDQVTGITRGLARKILSRKGIEIGKNDPIDVFINTFGESVTDVKNLAEEIVEAEQAGRKLKSADELLEIEGLFDIPIPKNPNKGLTNKEMLDLMEEVEAEDILKKFDPKDREPNAAGGIMRTNLAMGNPLPEDPTKPVNPFAPKPTGPVLPNKMASAPDPMDERNSMMETLSEKYYNKPLKDLTPKEIEVLEEAFDDLVSRKKKEAPSIKLAGGGLAYLIGM